MSSEDFDNFVDINKSKQETMVTNPVYETKLGTVSSDVMPDL